MYRKACRCEKKYLNCVNNDNQRDSDETTVINWLINALFEMLQTCALDKNIKILDTFIQHQYIVCFRKFCTMTFILCVTYYGMDMTKNVD